MNYSTDLGFAGLDLSFFGNWTNRSQFKANQNDPASLNRDCVGFYSVNCGSIQPEFSFTQRTTLQIDDVDLSLRWRYVDGVEVEPDANFGLAPEDGMCPDGGNLYDGRCRPYLEEFTTIPSEHYFDLTTVFNVTETFALTAAVINLFDNSPKVVGSNIGSTAYNSGNVYPSTYDTLGRRYSVSARLTF